MSSTPRSFLTTNAIVGITLMIGLANNIVIAAVFGLTREVDAYYAALMLPNLFMVLCVDYLGKNFLPMFARARKEGGKSASELTSSVVTLAGLLAFGVTVVLVLGSRVLFRLLLPGFDSAAIELVCRDFFIMAPAIVLMSITMFHQYVCQHDEEYARLTAINSALPLANLAAIVLASPMIGVYALPVGYLLGQVVVFVLMARQAKYRYRWRLTIRKDWERKIFSSSGIVMGSGLLARSRSLITNYLASLLGGGAISAIAMSSRLTLPLGRSIFQAVRLVMFSRTARLAVERNSREIARLYNTGLSAGFLILAPLLWWIGLNTAIIVDVIFVRGEFDLRMATLVSLALIGAVPSVLFIDVNALLSNAFYALERIAVPAAVMPVGTLIYLAFAAWLSGRFGVVGLTASASLSAAVIFVVMAILLSKQLEHFSAKTALLRLLRYVVLGGACVGIPVAALRWFEMPPMAAAAVSLIVGLTLYVAVLYTAGDRSLKFVYELVRRAAPARRVAGDTPG